MTHSLDSAMILFVVLLLSVFLAVELRKAIKHGIANMVRTTIKGLSYAPHAKKREILSRDLQKGKW